MQLNLRNLKKMIEKDLPKAIKPDIDRLIDNEVERRLEEAEAMMEEREELHQLTCPDAQKKGCLVQFRQAVILEFRKKEYLSPKFYQSKEWLSLTPRRKPTL